MKDNSPLSSANETLSDKLKHDKWFAIDDHIELKFIISEIDRRNIIIILSNNYYLMIIKMISFEKTYFLQISYIKVIKNTKC